MKIKKIAITAIGIIILILIAINVKATNNLKATLSSSKTQLTKEEEVEITLKFEQYEQIEDGINAYKAKFEYDKEIFEEVLQENFECQNDWEQLKYNKETGEFVAIKKAGSTEPEEVAKIKLKVKENIKAKKTEVITSEVVTSEGKEDILIENAKVEIDIVEEQTEKPIDPVEPIEPDKITSEKYNIEEEYISRILPKTTVKEFKQNVTTKQQMVFTDENGNELKEDSMIKTGTKLKVGTTLNFTLIVIGDIDKDAQITINDIAEMKLHIIEYKLLTGMKLKAADIDNDNRVTINDLAQLKLILIDLLKL